MTAAHVADLVLASPPFPENAEALYQAFKRRFLTESASGARTGLTASEQIRLQIVLKMMEDHQMPAEEFERLVSIYELVVKGDPNK